MEKIKELMERQNMSWKEFSIIYGIPYSTLRKWIVGERKPPDYVINLLEEVVLHDIWLGEHGRA